MNRPAPFQWALLGSLALAAISPLQAQETHGEGSSARYHVVQSGDVLSRIARQYGVSTEAIAAANNLKSVNYVPLGRRLLIPSPAHGDAVPPRPQQRPQQRPQPQARRASRISVSFNDVDVRDALAQIANYAHSDILLTPGATGAISINLRSRTPDEAIRLVTAAAGLSVVKVGGAYIVGPAAEVQKAVGEFARTEIVPLRYLTSADVTSVLGRLVPRLRVDATRGGVVLSGLAEDIATARNAISELDVEPVPAQPPKSETTVLNLSTVDPSNAEKVVHEAFPNIRVSRQDRALIMTGLPEDLQAAQRAVSTIDVAPAAGPSEVFIYRLKYLNAIRAQDSLKQALPNLVVALAPEPIAPPAAIFNPLSGGFTSATGGGSAGGGGTGGGGAGGNGGGGASGGGAGASSGTGSTGGASGGGTGPQVFSRATRLVLIGSAADLTTARGILEQTDLPQSLVRIEALVVEVNTTNEKNLGINWDLSGSGFTFTEPTGTDLRFGALTRSGGSFAVTLQALMTQNRARILARPNISVVDNEDANIFIGDLVRFRGTTIVSPNVGTIQEVDTIPNGIALLVRPHVHPNGDVTMKVHPVVSSFVLDNNGLPQTSSREADTTVRLHEGEELVIGGLDRATASVVENRLPILGDIPFIGELFRSRTKRNEKNEIVVVIRAYPVLTDAAPPRDVRRGFEK